MNPDTHLLYEYMNKLPFTVRMKVRLDAPIDTALLGKRRAIHSDMCQPLRVPGPSALIHARHSGLSLKGILFSLSLMPAFRK